MAAFGELWTRGKQRHICFPIFLAGCDRDIDGCEASVITGLVVATRSFLRDSLINISGSSLLTMSNIVLRVAGW